MNFGLDKAQKAFAELAKDFLDRECGSEIVRQSEELEQGFPVELYQKLANQGLLGLNIDAEFGGSAVGYTEIVLFLPASWQPPVTRTLYPLTYCNRDYPPSWNN